MNAISGMDDKMGPRERVAADRSFPFPLLLLRSSSFLPYGWKFLFSSYRKTRLILLASAIAWEPSPIPDLEPCQIDVYVFFKLHRDFWPHQGSEHQLRLGPSCHLL
jgi:hypothetical protein